MLKLTTLPVALCLALFCAGCVHKINVQQGNYLEDAQIQKVAQGMSRDQVKFLLGTPVADDPFTVDRWDYVYYFRNGRTGETARKQVVVYFENDKVSRIDQKTGRNENPNESQIEDEIKEQIKDQSKS